MAVSCSPGALTTARHLSPPQWPVICNMQCERVCTVSWFLFLVQRSCIAPVGRHHTGAVLPHPARETYECKDNFTPLAARAATPAIAALQPTTHVLRLCQETMHFSFQQRPSWINPMHIYTVALMTQAQVTHGRQKAMSMITYFSGAMETSPMGYIYIDMYR